MTAGSEPSKPEKRAEVRFFRADNLVHMTGSCGGTVGFCGAFPKSGGFYTEAPKGVKRCPKCQESEFAKQVTIKGSPAPNSHLAIHDIEEGDIWHTFNGGRVKVLYVWKDLHRGTGRTTSVQFEWQVVACGDPVTERRFDAPFDEKMFFRLEPRKSKVEPEIKPWSVFIRGGGLGHRVWIDGYYEAICGAKPDENAETCNDWPRNLPRCPKCVNVWNTFIETGKRPEVKPENAFPQRGEVWEMANGRTVKVGRVVGSYIMTEKDEIAINDLKKKVEALKPEVKPEVPVAARAGKTPILLGDTWMDDQGHEFHVCGIWPPKEGRKTVTVCYQYPYTSWETCNSPCGRKQFHKLVSRWSEPVEPPKPESKPVTVWKQGRVFSRGFGAVHSFLAKPGTTLTDTYSLCRESLYGGEQFYDEASMPTPWKEDLCEGCEAEWQKLTSPKPAETKPERPTDLAMFGLKEGDKWLTNAGVRFIVQWVSKRHTRTLATIQFAYDGKSQTVKNVAKEAHLFVKLVERNGVEVDPLPVSKTVPKPEVNAAPKKDIKDGDVWENEEGHTVEVEHVGHLGDETVAVVLYNGKVRMFGYLNNDHLFHKLVRRAGQKPEAKAAPMKDVVGKGIAVNDLWQYRSEENSGPFNFRVLCFHGGIAFCSSEDRSGRDHFIAKPTDKWFQTLLERNGKMVKAKRPQPTRGMDLATYSIHKGDKWQTLAGCKFTVIVPKDDGKGRIQSVIIEDENGSRVDLAQLSLDFFHYLIERDGKNMEEA
jgi:hypothetical protein